MKDTPRIKLTPAQLEQLADTMAGTYKTLEWGLRKLGTGISSKTIESESNDAIEVLIFSCRRCGIWRRLAHGALDVEQEFACQTCAADSFEGQS